MSDSHSVRRPSAFAASTAYWIACVGLALVAFGALSPLGELGLTAVYYALFVALPVLLWKRRHAPEAPALRLNPPAFRQVFWIAAAALLCAHAMTNLEVLWMGVLQRLGLNVFALEGVAVDTRQQLMQALLCTALIAPAAEELLFRGMLLSTWEPRGRARAILGTAALFALMHAAPAALPVQWIMGMLLGACACWSDTLYASMIFHMLYNAATLIEAHVAAGLESDPALVSRTHADILGTLGAAQCVALLALALASLLIALVVLAKKVRAPQAEDEPAPQAQPMGAFSASDAVILTSGALTCVCLTAVNVVNMLGGWG